MPAPSTPQRRVNSKRVVSKRVVAVVLAGVLLVAVGIVGFALKSTDRIGLAGWRGGASADASAALERAAAAAERVGDPRLEDGQFREITVTSVASTREDLGEHGSWAYLTKVTEHEYVPKDLRGDWFWVRPMPVPVKGLTPGSWEQAKRDYARQIAAHPHGDGTLRGPGGAFYAGDPVFPASLYRTMPTDPTRLLNQLYDTAQGSSGPDGDVVGYLADLFTTGRVPATYRAAFFRVLQMIPGVTAHAEQVDYDGQRGIAIGRSQGDYRQEIIIDPVHGSVVGTRLITQTTVEGIPPGTAIEWNRISVEVVDSAPTTGTICADGDHLERGVCVSG